ncbi:hypothetical protein MUK42_33369, partial [Musa troglodytarum]
GGLKRLRQVVIWAAHRVGTQVNPIAVSGVSASRVLFRGGKPPKPDRSEGLIRFSGKLTRCPKIPSYSQTLIQNLISGPVLRDTSWFVFSSWQRQRIASCTDRLNLRRFFDSHGVSAVSTKKFWSIHIGKHETKFSTPDY